MHIKLCCEQRSVRSHLHLVISACAKRVSTNHMWGGAMRSPDLRATKLSAVDVGMRLRTAGDHKAKRGRAKACTQSCAASSAACDRTFTKIKSACAKRVSIEQKGEGENLHTKLCCEQRSVRSHLRLIISACAKRVSTNHMWVGAMRSPALRATKLPAVDVGMRLRNAGDHKAKRGRAKACTQSCAASSAACDRTFA